MTIKQFKESENGKFLIKHRAYKKFMRNTKESFGDYWFITISKNARTKDFLQFAFLWINAPEGPEFWEKLAKKRSKE